MPLENTIGSMIALIELKWLAAFARAFAGACRGGWTPVSWTLAAC